MASLLEVIRDDILQKLADDQLTLPTLPEVALQVRSVAEDPDADISQLTQTISKDPALSARILRIANSPLFRASQEIRDLHHAISRLGMNYTANLAIGLAMEQMFQATSDLIDGRMRRNWQLTTRVALYAAALSENSGVPADEAVLAALLHRIGVLPILAYSEESSSTLDGIELDKLVHNLHGEMGMVILDNWQFPKTLVAVPKNYRKVRAGSAQPTLCDIVTAANLLVFADKDNYFGRIDWATVPVFAQLNLPTDRNAPEIKAIHKAVSENSSLF